MSRIGIMPRRIGAPIARSIRELHCFIGTGTRRKPAFGLSAFWTAPALHRGICTLVPVSSLFRLLQGFAADGAPDEGATTQRKPSPLPRDSGAEARRFDDRRSR